MKRTLLPTLPLPFPPVNVKERVPATMPGNRAPSPDAPRDRHAVACASVACLLGLTLRAGCTGGGANRGGIVVLASSLATATSGAVDSSGVYWTEANGGTVGGIINGQGFVPLATGQPNPSEIASNGSDVVWTNGAAGGNGGSIGQWSDSWQSTVATSHAFPVGIAADATYLYWADYNDGTIRTMTFANASPPAVAASGQAGPGYASRSTAT